MIMPSFGAASPFIPRINKAGALAACQVQSLAQARALLDEGADLIIERLISDAERALARRFT